VTYGELKRKLKKNGNRFHHEGSSHEMWKNIKTGKLFPMGRHDSQEVPKGTLSSILKDAGLK
jgi:predicted RNA binding protein YcfA (HicA-like mRNA interferase family)